jgi:hypothetical protein
MSGSPCAEFGNGEVGPALPDVSTLEVEIARLRDLDVSSLRRWLKADLFDEALQGGWRQVATRSLLGQGG